MRSRARSAVCLLGVFSVCLAHDPLPIQSWDDAIDVKAIANLTIAEDEIEGEAARLPNLDAGTEAPCNPAARTAPVPTDDEWMLGHDFAAFQASLDPVEMALSPRCRYIAPP